MEGQATAEQPRTTTMARRTRETSVAPAHDDARSAATAAIRELGPDVLRYLRATLRDEADAGDAFAVFAERLWKGLASFRGECPLRAWALRIAFNAARDVRDEAWRRRVRPFEPGEASAIAEEVRTTSRRRRERESAGLDRMRLTLSPEEQTLLTLRLDQRLSWADIAAVLSTPGRPTTPGAVHKRYERLTERLTRLARLEGLVE
jgi:RNA polymerase sigma-70 factor (ECF subfamily)